MPRGDGDDVAAGTDLDAQRAGGLEPCWHRTINPHRNEVLGKGALERHLAALARHPQLDPRRQLDGNAIGQLAVDGQMISK